MIANFSEEALIIPKATVLSIAEQVPETLVGRINARSRENSDPPKKPRRKSKNEALYHKLLQRKLDHLSQEENNLIKLVLLRYAHVLHDDETNDFKGKDMVEHQILLENVQPIRRPQYQTLYALRSEMKAQIEKMLEKGIMGESCSSWSAPAILVPKKSPDGKPKFRFCVFRALNSVTKFDPYPLPRFEENTCSIFPICRSTPHDVAGHWPATSWVHYTTNCNTQSSAPEDR
jgi:hypothetical protein